MQGFFVWMGARCVAASECRRYALKKNTFQTRVFNNGSMTCGHHYCKGFLHTIREEARGAGFFSVTFPSPAGPQGSAPGHNIRAMAGMRRTGCCSPARQTTMFPEIFTRQLAAGHGG
jgi:hypothetical protein